MPYTANIVVTTEETRANDGAQRLRPPGSIIDLYTDTPRSRRMGFAPRTPFAVLTVTDVPDIPFEEFKRLLLRPYYFDRNVLFRWRDIHLDLDSLVLTHPVDVAALLNPAVKQATVTFADFLANCHIAREGRKTVLTDFTSPRTDPNEQLETVR